MRCNNLIRNRLLLKSQLTKQVDFDVQLLLRLHWTNNF